MSEYQLWREGGLESFFMQSLDESSSIRGEDAFY